MSIENGMYDEAGGADIGGTGETDFSSQDVLLPLPTAAEVEQMDIEDIPADGIDVALSTQSFDTEGERIANDIAQAPFDANLADIIPTNYLHKISTHLLEEYENDLLGREEWEKSLQDGFDLLGIKRERVTDPWPGATDITHPMLIESIVRFQSEAIVSTFPPHGPVKTNIIGKETPEKLKASQRVQADLNYQLTEIMTEFRPEHERMLWHLALAGSAFKKVYYDPTLGRQVSMFVGAEDIILPYGASELRTTCPRITHRMRKQHNEVLKLQGQGFYTQKIVMQEPAETIDEIDSKRDEITGITTTIDRRHQFLEFHTILNLNYFLNLDADKSDIAEPYVITINKANGDVLGLRRNWLEEDNLALPRTHFVHYQYIPGFGSYGFGLINIIGGYARGATTLLRQLADAGTLANLPGGFKTKGLRVKNENEPIKPGEFRDVDISSGTLKDNIVPFPYKEPSATLLNLLTQIIDDGRRLAGMAELKISDMSAQMPVGTTLALLEQNLKVMSAVHARLHNSLKQELRLLANLIRDYTPDVYAYEVDAPQGAQAKKDDYEYVEIYPVSDPNASTLAQKIVQYQAVIQLASTAPQIYNLPELHRQMIDTLGIKNAAKLLPASEESPPLDPISENMAIMMCKPVKAFVHQDHEAHLKTHMAAMNDPLIRAQLGQDPRAQQIAGAAYAHISEHMAYAYRNQIEQQLGVPLPPPNEPLPPQIEVQLSRLIADASDRLLQKNTTAAAAQQAQQAANDPIIQNEIKDLQIKEKEVTRKQLKDLIDALMKGEKLQLDERKLSVEEFMAGIKHVAETQQNNLQNVTTEAQNIAKNSQFAQGLQHKTQLAQMGYAARQQQGQQKPKKPQQNRPKGKK